MYGKIKEYLTKEIQSIHDAGLYKAERVIMTPQGPEIEVKGGKKSSEFLCKQLFGPFKSP